MRTPNTLVSAFVLLVFAGCYTELGTVREAKVEQPEEYTYREDNREVESEEDTGSFRYNDDRAYYDDYYYDRWTPRYRFSFRYYYPAYYWPSFTFAYGFYDPWYYDPWICGTPIVIYPGYYYPSWWYSYYPYYYPYYRFRHHGGYSSIVRTNRDFGSTRGGSIRTGGYGGMRSGGSDGSGETIERIAKRGGRSDVPIVRDGGQKRSGRGAVIQKDGSRNRSGGNREGVRRDGQHRRTEPMRENPPDERQATHGDELRGGTTDNNREQVKERNLPVRRIVVRDVPPPVMREGNAERPQRTVVREPRRSGPQRESSASPPSQPTYSPPRSSPPPAMRGGDGGGGGSRSGGGERGGGSRPSGRR